MASQPAKTRRVPQRTCIACRRVDPKKQLVRLVRTADNSVIIDPTGKAAGRGAYLCTSRTCWEAALKRGMVNRALRVTINNTDQATLSEYAQHLLTDEQPQVSAMN